MDFITNLPSSASKTVIWMVVDRLTKFAHFVAFPTGFTALSLTSKIRLKLLLVIGTTPSSSNFGRNYLNVSARR